MSKSYFEWELSFRKKGAQPRSSYSKKGNSYLHREVNSLGIPKNEFGKEKIFELFSFKLLRNKILIEG